MYGKKKMSCGGKTHKMKAGGQPKVMAGCKAHSMKAGGKVCSGCGQAKCACKKMKAGGMARGCGAATRGKMYSKG